MKKVTALLNIALLGLLTFALSSCDPYYVGDYYDDYNTAAVLNGTWHGSLGQYYYNDIYGEGYGEWETEFRFDNFDGSTRTGEGLEVDYDPDFWSDYKAYPFVWEVANGNIYLDYDNGDRLVIRSYRLTDSRLSGRLETLNGIFVANLSLVRTSYWPWNISYAKGTRAAKDLKVGQKRNFENLK